MLNAVLASFVLTYMVSYVEFNTLFKITLSVRPSSCNAAVASSAVEVLAKILFMLGLILGSKSAITFPVEVALSPTNVPNISPAARILLA